MTTDPDPTPAPPAAPPTGGWLQGRYEVGTLWARCGPVARHLGLDHIATGGPLPVWILRQAAPPAGPDGSPAPPPAGGWPSLDWEQGLLERARQLGLPRVLDRFTEAGVGYLIEEMPAGQDLRSAWEAPTATAAARFGWLLGLADLLDALHAAGAVLEGLRPDQVAVSPVGQVLLTDLADLLPLPVPADVVPRGLPSSAPELLAGPAQADARSDLYVFGAVLWSLLLGRDLGPGDFLAAGVPRPWLEANPDAHPLLGRLLGKTLHPERRLRFPTEAAAGDDPTGFAELALTLEVCRRQLDSARLDLAAWSSTGMVRPGNEDAYTLLHTADAREDQRDEFALVLLADGMGGTEGGEVAAALALHTLRQYLLRRKEEGGRMKDESEKPLLIHPPPFRPPPSREWVEAALAEANRAVWLAAAEGVGRPGMGCTAEVLLLDGRRLVGGHVGDSRAYLVRSGRLVPLTRDHSVVERLIELGEISPEQARTHPRRSELRQALGGGPDVEPDLYEEELLPGDWVLVCSDGLTNQLGPEVLTAVLAASATAEQAARRLVNRANLEGATDNVTVAVVRVA